MKEVLGWRNLRGLNKGFFVTIYPLVTSSFGLNEELEKYCVRGLLTDNSEDISTTWETPLQGKGLESMINSTLLANAQSGAIDSLIGKDYLKGKTLVTQKETLSIFTQSQPMGKDLSLTFTAQRDPVLEVEAPYRFLQKLASPQLVESFLSTIKDGIDPLHNKTLEQIAEDSELIGETPLDVAIIIGNKRSLTGSVRITNVSSSDSNVQIGRGGITHRVVNLTLNTNRSPNRDEIKLF